MSMVRLHRDLVNGSAHASRLTLRGRWEGDYLHMPEVDYARVMGYTPEVARPLPPLPHRLRSLAAAMVRWVRAGCAIASPRVRAARRGICPTCPHWRPRAWLKPAHCAYCGCALVAKVVMGTESCPVGKW